MENIWKNLRKWKKAVIFFADFVLCFFLSTYLVIMRKIDGIS